MRAILKICVLLFIGLIAVGMFAGGKQKGQTSTTTGVSTSSTKSSNSSSSAPTPFRTWRVGQSKDAMTDTLHVQLLTVAENPTPDTLGRPTYAELYIECVENKTQLVVWADRFINTDSIKVRYRIDDQKAVTEWWNISTAYEHVGKWGGAVPLVRRLLDADRFVVEFTPYGANTMRAEFRVSGLRQVIGPLADACHWKP